MKIPIDEMKKKFRCMGCRSAMMALIMVKILLGAIELHADINNLPEAEPQVQKKVVEAENHLTDTVFIDLTKTSSERVRDFMDSMPYSDGDIIYNEFKGISRRCDSLYNIVEKWLTPSSASPFFISKENGRYEFKPLCHKDTVTVDKDLYMMLKFILSVSDTRYYSGLGPTVMIYLPDNNIDMAEKIMLNYGQLLGAITWYKLNKNYITDDTFLAFMISPTGSKYRLLNNECQLDIFIGVYVLGVKWGDLTTKYCYYPPRVPESELDRISNYESDSVANMIIKQKRILPFLNLTIDSSDDYEEFLNYQESFSYPKDHRLYGY